MERFYVDGSFKSQYDDIARRVLSIGGRAVTGTRGGYTNNEVLVKISGIYEPEGGYNGEEQLQLIGSEVVFKFDGSTSEGVLNFDPNDTESEDSSGKINLAVPIYVIDVDFDKSNPQNELETYQNKIIRASQFSMLGEDGEYEVMWVAKLGGAGDSSQEIFDCVVDDGDDNKPDEYEVSVWNNYYGRTYHDPSEAAPIPLETEAIMLIEGAVGTRLPNDNVVPCRAFTEYHDPPIGSPPDPPDPLPPDYTEPSPPYATKIYRPINIWRYQ